MVIRVLRELQGVSVCQNSRRRRSAGWPVDTGMAAERKSALRGYVGDRVMPTKACCGDANPFQSSALDREVSGVVRPVFA